MLDADHPAATVADLGRIADQIAALGREHPELAIPIRKPEIGGRPAASKTEPDLTYEALVAKIERLDAEDPRPRPVPTSAPAPSPTPDLRPGPELQAALDAEEARIAATGADPLILRSPDDDGPEEPYVASDHPPAADDHLSFTAVRMAPRRDGWSAERQRRFIALLAETGSVRDSAEAVEMTARSAYRLRARAEASDFARAWDQALTVVSGRLAAVAFERALHGSERIVWVNGREVRRERVPSDRLLMFLLRHYNPGRFAGAVPAGLPAPDTPEIAAVALADLSGRLADTTGAALAPQVGPEDFPA